MLGAGAVGTLAAGDAAPNPWFSLSYIRGNGPAIVGYVGEHVRLTVLAVLIGSVVALPLALVARRSRWVAGPFLGLSTIVYTVPSLAFFALLLPFTGLSATTVLIGLAAYSLVVLLRNFLAGLTGIDPDVREAARGMGYGSARLFFSVDLPLALPTFIAGLRIATVTTVAEATVGVIVGHGGLGQLIVGGFNANFYRAEIITGALGCVLLALVLDLVLVGVQRVLTPWTRAVRS